MLKGIFCLYTDVFEALGATKSELIWFIDIQNNSPSTKELFSFLFCSKETSGDLGWLELWKNGYEKNIPYVGKIYFFMLQYRTDVHPECLGTVPLFLS